jgi:hypothetical protein
MQQHRHLAYILAGSRRALLDAMLAPDAAFYKMLTPLRFGPIDADHMAGWSTSGTVANTLAHFEADGLLVRTTHGAGWTFDDPFFRCWVVARVLPDVHQHLPITHVANPTSEYDRP